MKNLFKHILFGAAIFAGMGLFVGCDTMTDDEIEKLINDKLNDNATADATPPVELAGTTWVSHYGWIREEYDEDSGEYIEYEAYREDFLHFTETTVIGGSKIYKKEDDSLLEEWDWSDDPINYYVQGNIILMSEVVGEENPPYYFPPKDCIILDCNEFYRVEE